MRSLTSSRIVGWMLSGSSRSTKKKSDSSPSCCNCGICPALMLCALVTIRLAATCGKNSPKAPRRFGPAANEVGECRTRPDARQLVHVAHYQKVGAFRQSLDQPV